MPPLNCRQSSSGETWVGCAWLSMAIYIYIYIYLYYITQHRSYRRIDEDGLQMSLVPLLNARCRLQPPPPSQKISCFHLGATERKNSCQSSCKSTFVAMFASSEDRQGLLVSIHMCHMSCWPLVASTGAASSSGGDPTSVRPALQAGDVWLHIAFQSWKPFRSTFQTLQFVERVGSSRLRLQQQQNFLADHELMEQLDPEAVWMVSFYDLKSSSQPVAPLKPSQCVVEKAGGH